MLVILKWETESGDRAQETEKWKMGRKQRIGNEVTDRARVQELGFVPLSVPRFSKIHFVTTLGLFIAVYSSGTYSNLYNHPTLIKDPPKVWICSNRFLFHAWRSCLFDWPRNVSVHVLRFLSKLDKIILRTEFSPRECVLEIKCVSVMLSFSIVSVSTLF